MYIKIHKSYRLVVAIADSDLIGKEFEEGGKALNVTENFYKGEKLTKEEMEKIMIDFSGNDATFNIVGKKAIDVALKCGIVIKDGIKTVDGIPFALVLL